MNGSLDDYLASKTISDSTRESYERILKLFLAEIVPELCTPADIRAFLKRRKWGECLSYMASVCIRGYICWRFGAEHPAAKIRIKRSKRKPGRVLESEKVRELLESFDTSKVKGIRDLAICALALDTGLRVGELASAKFSDVNFLKRSMLVKVKGGRWETAVFSEYTRSLILAWVGCREAGDDRLFQITRDGLRVTVRRWGEKLGIKLSAHDMRRTFAVMALRAGAPSRVVQVAGRWSSLAMVELYSQAINASDFERYFPINQVYDD